MFIHLLSAISSRLNLAQNIDGFSLGDSFECFRLSTLSAQIAYNPYCDDFGPVSMACVVDFIRLLDAKLVGSSATKMILCVDAGRRALTNAVFLLGSYMILRQGKASSDVAASFHWLERQMEPYRDASNFSPDFALHLIDCWRGLEKGVQQGWVRFGGLHHMWGMIDVDEFRHHDNPANGSLQEVVPGKFVALKGPVDLGGAEYRDDVDGARSFSPAFYADILLGMDVRTVVGLDAPQYAAEALTSRGFAHHSLEFPAGAACPSDAVVVAFLRAVDAAPGAVAVHCRTGRGRTGTLIALYLMRSCGFTAREAMGWLRIMRPGSVIGEQQHYLCAVDSVLQGMRSRASDRESASPAASLAGYCCSVETLK